MGLFIKLHFFYFSWYECIVEVPLKLSWNVPADIVTCDIKLSHLCN